MKFIFIPDCVGFRHWRRVNISGHTNYRGDTGKDILKMLFGLIISNQLKNLGISVGSGVVVTTRD